MGNYGYQKKYFGIFDRQLDNYKNGPMWLMKEEIASVVKEAIHLRDGKEYDLIAYTIMPNHVHLVITPIKSNNVSRSEASTNTQTNQKTFN
jgi:REP element-mobilizing transposase RayT